LNTSNGANLQRGETSSYPPFASASSAVRAVYVVRAVRCFVTPCITLPVESALLHSVNLILFTVLLVHLILRMSPHHSHHLHFHSHHLSLPLPFTPDLKLISFTNSFLHSHSYSFRTDLSCTELKGHCLFVRRG